MLEQNRTNHSFRFESRSFSPFAVVALVGAASALVPASHSVAGYAPATKGWNIANFGNYFSPGGNCLGMSGYATWYFASRTDNLAAKFSAAPLAGAGSPSVAELVATRAHMAQSQYWAQKSNTYLSVLGTSATGKLMKMYLSLLNQPLILLLGTAGSPRHASVVYGYDANGFLFYDVNVPAAVQTVSHVAGTWGTFSGYDTFTYVALPSLGRTEDFAQLTTEGEGGFTSSAAIAVSTPTPGSTVSTRSVNLTGSLIGLPGASKVVAFVKGIEQAVPVTGTSFSSTLPITNGANTVVLLAGVDIGQQSNWFRNAATRVVTVTGDAANTNLLVTLTWDQDASDVDLYVLEPGGQTAWFSNFRTSNRLSLDFDNTSGFGPEHTTLSTAAAVPGTVLAGIYKVRVHYYSGTPRPVTGTVTILVNEGQLNQRLVSKRFTIGTASSGNSNPTATGSDWIEIADVDLVAGTVVLSP